ncbi:hypothetical protein M431DRAFT_430123 [Trichoderma harzianum CBS 226.95]|uniref:Uncharacterized protein n=1 Tax=Trichoderma harzianum CBS 226.95 TaxID=983964 RepID=A0A2T4ACL3_TRIHA|nr:hypothetical protein M431DRAFT_430123 [Trichoderma harzianum CBS 226.95]PTB54819.1 hypothetical protein M431DRAFT_430123 [Trichoderma harzianum CBS 226.95]
MYRLYAPIPLCVVRFVFEIGCKRIAKVIKKRNTRNGRANQKKRSLKQEKRIYMFGTLSKPFASKHVKKSRYTRQERRKKSCLPLLFFFFFFFFFPPPHLWLNKTLLLRPTISREPTKPNSLSPAVVDVVAPSSPLLLHVVKETEK